jgi:hypothetical protein
VSFLNLFKVISFDFTMLDFACVVVTNYHSIMYASAVFAAIMLFVVLFQLRRFHAARKLQKRNELELEAALYNGRPVESGAVEAVTDTPDNTMLSACLVASYLIYPSCTTVFSQAFNCRRIDGVAFLTRDLSVPCAASAHQKAELVASLMLAAFSCGLPALYLAMMYPHRHKHGLTIARKTLGGGNTGLYGSMSFL